MWQGSSTPTSVSKLLKEVLRMETEIDDNMGVKQVNHFQINKCFQEFYRDL